MSQIMNRQPHEIVGSADFAELQAANKYTQEQSVLDIEIPHFAIHGSDDPTVLVDEVYDFKKWNENTIVEEIKGANHVFGVSHPYNESKFPLHFQSALDKTVEFLK